MLNGPGGTSWLSADRNSSRFGGTFPKPSQCHRAKNGKFWCFSIMVRGKTEPPFPFFRCGSSFLPTRVPFNPRQVWKSPLEAPAGVGRSNPPIFLGKPPQQALDEDSSFTLWTTERRISPFLLSFPCLYPFLSPTNSIYL